MMLTGSGKEAAAPASMQLNLFQWDLLAVGNGYRSLASLDFSQAMGQFIRVLDALPNHQAAGEGLRTTQYWQETFETLPTLEGEKAVAYLWQRLRTFAFDESENDRALRTNLLRQLQTVMEHAGVDYLPPDLCHGFLSLQLREYEAAENQLRSLMEIFPEDGLLYGYLADTLWLQKRRELANSFYALALLLAPDLMANHTVCNQRLATIIAGHGAALAPIYGYLDGVLPLVEQEIAMATEEAGIYAHYYGRWNGPGIAATMRL